MRREEGRERGTISVNEEEVQTSSAMLLQLVAVFTPLFAI
jgi:hypothetical protein